jgi:hypothetical protein
MPTTTAIPVYVIGSGRSGTHWLGYTLAAHPEVKATIEVKAVFELVTTIALDESQEEALFPRLVERYRKQLASTSRRVYLDKSHPNIWLAERLLEAFPAAQFVGIERSPYATVASMFKHGGVSAWHRRWREFPVPNRFLGITEEMVSTYDQCAPATRFAVRWLAHQQRMSRLEEVLADRLMVVDYQRFARRPDETVGRLQRFLGLHAPIPVPEIKVDSLDRWREELDDNAVAQIQAVVGHPPEHYAGGD